MINKIYDALLVDTTIYDTNGLRLETGLLGKLAQFRKSTIDLLLPDVIKSEVISHLEQKIKEANSSLEKSLNDARDYLFFVGSALVDSNKFLIDSREIKGLADSRIEKFISHTGALVLECGNYVSVSSLLIKYFSNSPPFAEKGKKKNEFPDAIVLMAVESWAATENKYVLAVSQDKDWAKYCESSEGIDCLEDLGSALDVLNQNTVPYNLLYNLKQAIKNNLAQKFLSRIEDELIRELDGFTPDQEADSFFYWEPDGCHGWFKAFHLIGDDFRIVDKGEKMIVMEVTASITIEAEGVFSLGVYDSIDHDYVSMGSITATTEEEFVSEILITITGDLYGQLDQLTVGKIEIVNPISLVNFGTIEPDYGPDELD